MFTKSILAIAFVAASAPAFANPGTDQLALQLGVQPGVYSATQLIDLQEATRENDKERIAFILRQGNDVASRDNFSSNPASPGAAQFALSLGLEPGRYTLNELQAIQDARNISDEQTERFFVSGENRTVRGDSGVVTPGKAQIAAQLGVDPAAYTLTELTVLLGELND